MTNDQQRILQFFFFNVDFLILSVLLYLFGVQEAWIHSVRYEYSMLLGILVQQYLKIQH